MSKILTPEEVAQYHEYGTRHDEMVGNLCKSHEALRVELEQWKANAEMLRQKSLDQLESERIIREAAKTIKGNPLHARLEAAEKVCRAAVEWRDVASYADATLLHKNLVEWEKTKK